MDTLSAVARARENEGQPHKVFNWNMAAQLIHDRKPVVAVAGLSSDMEYTAGEIYRDGKIVPEEETYVFLASNWAIPVLVLDNGEEIECWAVQLETDEWGSDTYWPDSARAILAK